jgi:hypothetical protein
LWEAFPVGATVELKDATPVRASVVAALLRGVRPAQPGEASGLRLRGALVTGALDLTYATVTAPVLFQECVFDEVPDLTCATTRGIQIVSCELPGFTARLLRAEGNLDFHDSVVRGQLGLVRATITGELRLNGARLLNPDGWALFAGGLVVESAVFGSFPRERHPGEASTICEGGLRLNGARLKGGLFLGGVQVRRPGGVALFGENMVVSGRMFCGDGFAAEGSVQMPHARVDGALSFAGATVHDLSLTNAVVEVLDLRTAGAATGVVDLRHSRCNVLRDAEETWPAAIALDGLVYDAIDTSGRGLRVASRLNWLRRERDGYRPQPYEQLAALYRRLGADPEARRVLLDKQRRRRRDARPLSRLFGHVLDWTVGYGYRPWLAALWLIVMLGVGSLVFSVWPPTRLVAGRHFDAVVYTFDLLLPISAFGLRDSFVPIGSTRWLAYALTAAGWLLLTALVAGVTRTLRRD